MQCYLDFFTCDLSVYILFYCHRTSYLVNITIYLDIYIIYSKVHILNEYIFNNTFIKVYFSVYISVFFCFKLAVYCMSHTVYLLPVSSSVQHVIMMEYESCNLHVDLMCFFALGSSSPSPDLQPWI